MAGPDGTTRGGMRPWLKAVLFLSLALNLMVLGLVAGSVLRGPDRHMARDGRDSVAPYTRAFTESQRRDLGRALRDELGAARRGNRTDFLRDYAEALEVLRAEPFDRAALDAVLERQAVRAEDRLRAGQAVMSDQIAAMTPEDRRAFADRLETALGEMAERRARWLRD